jgi:hypothetical protein
MKNRKKTTKKSKKNKQLTFFSFSLSQELRIISNNGAISRYFSSHVLHLIRVEFKRGCKPNIPRHFQIRLILSAIFSDYAHIYSQKLWRTPYRLAFKYHMSAAIIKCNNGAAHERDYL